MSRMNRLPKTVRIGLARHFDSVNKSRAAAICGGGGCHCSTGFVFWSVLHIARADDGSSAQSAPNATTLSGQLPHVNTIVRRLPKCNT
jgi:hypothetical protein